MEHLFSRRGFILSLSTGFTLIELMVVLAIITVITAVVFTNQSAFNKTLILGNTAYDIALTLRSVQSHGIGSRAVTNTAGSIVSERAGYGLHFARDTTRTLILFADTFPSVSCDTPDCKPGDHAYTNANDTPLQTYTLGNGMTIRDFCAFANGNWSCAITGSLTALDIVFVRPNPNPFISANGIYSPLFPITAACLSVTSPQGGSKFVSVAASGQISASATSCP